MRVWRIFSGKSPEEYGQRGDALFETAEYGLAKIVTV